MSGSVVKETVQVEVAVKCSDYRFCDKTQLTMVSKIIKNLIIGEEVLKLDTFPDFFSLLTWMP